MKPEQIENCKGLINRYNAVKTNIEIKETLRNQIYQILKTPIIKWISSIMAERKVYEESDEILSMSWDCFEFCLKWYDESKDIPLPNHFFAYTKFFLLHRWSKSKKADIQIDDIDGAIHLGDIRNDFDIVMYMDELKSYYEALPKEYRMIFQDTVKGITGQQSNPKRRPKNMSLTQYHEFKRIFKITIDFLLRR